MFKEQEFEMQKDEQRRRIRELKKQLEEELQKAQEMEQDRSEMQVDEEEYEDYEWENDEAGDWYQAETKGSSSKESSYEFFDASKDSQNNESSPKEKLQML